jgi:hypothetical protein
MEKIKSINHKINRSINQSINQSEVGQASSHVPRELLALLCTCTSMVGYIIYWIMFFATKQLESIKLMQLLFSYFESGHVLSYHSVSHLIKEKKAAIAHWKHR